jgi:hypothetical protein
MTTINDLIDNVGKGDNVAAGKAFDTVIAQKLQAALDARKIDIASSIGKEQSSEDEEVE